MAVEVEKSQRALHFALERVNNDVAFVLCKVEDSFSSNATFSRLNLTLGAHNNGLRRIALSFNSLFKVEAKSAEFQGAVQFIHSCENQLWPPFHADPDFKLTETSVMLDICSKILAPLCTNVIMEKRYRTPLSLYLDRTPVPTNNLQCGNIGIGTIGTWHGTPDVQVRGGVNFVCGKREEASSGVDTTHESDSDSDHDSESESDGMTTTIEGKIKFKYSNLPRTIGTCVVSSFTEKSCHPDLPAIVPTILIDKSQFRVCLYECERDILLISSCKSLSTTGRLSQSAMALLWVVVNHRDFLQGLPQFVNDYPSGIRPRLEAYGSLQDFIDLHMKNLDWDVDKEEVRMRHGHLPIVYLEDLPLPPAKKMRQN